MIMEHASVSFYRVKTGTADNLTERLQAELPRIYCHQQGFVSYDLIKASDDTLLSLSMWETEEQANIAQRSAAVWLQQQVGNPPDATDTYVGKVAFSWHLAHLPASP
jgi:hypothetical protein